MWPPEKEEWQHDPDKQEELYARDTNSTVNLLQ